MPITARALADQSVLIAGGTSGIGLATARAFLAEGARVAVSGRDTERGAKAVQALHGKADFIACDCADPDAVQSMVARAEAALGRIDTLVCSTGGNRLPQLLHEIPLDGIRDSLMTDLAPFLLLPRAVLPGMMAQNGGTVISIASDAGKLATPGESVIGAGMAAIIQFMRGLAIEGKRSGIRAHTITPSLVEGTPLTERLMEEGTFSAKLFAKARPLANLGPTVPEDLAALAVFLASPAAQRMTGQAISINGGISAA